MPSSRRTLVAACATLAATGVGAALALAAASPTSPPTISGTPQYKSPLTCNPGSWSGAVSFGYRWLEDGSSYEVATGQAWTPQASNLERTYFCRVTATDAAGATATADSTTVKIAHPKMILKVKLSSPRSERIKVVATIGPKAALRDTGNRKAYITLYRTLSKSRYEQLTIPPKTVPTSGKVTFTVKAPAGRKSYHLQVTAANPSLYDGLQLDRKATVKRKKR